MIEFAKEFKRKNLPQKLEIVYKRDRLLNVN